MDQRASGEVGMTGQLSGRVLSRAELGALDRQSEREFEEQTNRGRRSRQLLADAAARWWRWRNWWQYRWRELGMYLFVCLLPAFRLFVPALCVVHAKLYGVVRRGDGTVENLGLIGRHLVVTAGKNYVASTFDNTAEPESLKYHGYGTGTTAAAAGDTALQTELTTQYTTDNTRPTGSQAHASATYTTVGTVAPDSGGTIAVTEWGLFSANAAGTLFDRQVFSAVNLVAANGDSLQTTYVLTLS